MQSQASFGRREQVAVLALRGVVRYPLATALRAFVDDVVLTGACNTVFIDLSAVEVLDSTAMGLLARIGRFVLERHDRKATLVAPRHDVAVCLEAAAFGTLFQLVDAYPFDPHVELNDVPLEAGLSAQAASVMLEAHRALAELGEANRATFSDVIRSLEGEVREKPKGAAERHGPFGGAQG